MNDDFISEPLTDEELESARLRRRKLRENATSIVKPKITLLSASLALLFIGTIVLSWFLFAMPNDVVKKWPQTKPYYEMLGIRLAIDPNARPVIDLKPYATIMMAEGDVYKLTVSGHIVNKSFGTVTLPPVIGTLLDSDGDAIYTWMFCLANRRLVAGQGTDYSYDIMAAPSNTTVAVVEIKWEKDADGNVIDTCPPIPAG